MSTDNDQRRTQAPPASNIGETFGDPWVLGLSAGFILLFVGLSIFDVDLVSQLVGGGFAWTAKYLGSYFQLLLLTFVIAIAVAISPAGGAVMGDLDIPEMSTFRWVAIIMCTLLAGGGVFFAAGEPVYHFIAQTPPAFDTETGTVEAIRGALAQSFMHWGFLAWAVLGGLTSLVLVHAHYVKGQPLQPRTLLYPVFGDRVMRGAFGGVVDAVCVISVVAGTVGPI
ncbi:BCCT family transporter, partial [Spiribacter sp. 1M153]|uniref:BCCT family transporter n=1 Tax=Spiribacter roseus TaxID=1855875 RepID=UPI00349F4482